MKAIGKTIETSDLGIRFKCIDETDEHLICESNDAGKSIGVSENVKIHKTRAIVHTKTGNRYYILNGKGKYVAVSIPD